MEFKYSEQPDLIKEMLPLFESDILNETFIERFYRDFKCTSDEELRNRIDSAIDFNSHTVDRVVLHPTDDYHEIDQLYLKYMALSPNQKLHSDSKAMNLFGMDNKSIYNFVKEHIVRPEQETDTLKHTIDNDTIETSDSVFTNDLPLLTPEELIHKVDENYSCFTEAEAKVIQAWREEYALLGNGIKVQSYDLHNLQRINILRNAIYENNTDAILQCGWIPGIEFNSENRVKACQIVKEKVKVSDSNNKNDIVIEAKSFPVQFDKEGNLILKNIKKLDFEQEYANSHRLLKEYEKTDSYDPMKFELAKMQFFITLLEKRIFKNGKSNSINELKVRARFLNDFKKYLKIISTNEPSFNFTEYYEQTPFNDALIKVDKDTLKYGFKALKYAIKG